MQARALTRIALLALITILLIASAAGASVISYTLIGVDSAGDPVSVRADFSVVAGVLSVDITNQVVDPKNTGQNVNALAFTLSTNQSTAPNPLTSVATFARTVGPTGSFSDVANAPTGWTLQQNFNDGLGLGFRLCVLCAGGAGPDTIIGNLAGGGTYASADSSIKGSSNNPFLASVVHYTITGIPGLTSDAYVDSAFLSFGTTDRTTLQTHCVERLDVSCQPERHRAPEPSSLLLVGAGLLGLAGFSLRKRLNTK